MRIVLVLPDPPLPFGATAARWFYFLLKGLVARGHEVTAFVACPSAELGRETAALFPAPKYDVRCFPYPLRGGWRAKWESYQQPYSYHFHPDLRADLERTLAKGFDILHLETHWTGWLGLAHTAKSVLNVHNLYTVDLAEDRGRETLIERWRTRRVFQAEKSLLQKFPHVLTLTEPLAEKIRGLSPTTHVQVVPQALDASLYPFATRTVSDARPVLGLIGSFNWAPTFSAGVRLLTRLWPAVQARVPQANLLLVGRKARSVLAPYLPASHADITIEENVPDIIPYFRQMTAMVYAPKIGTGLKIKVIEAFALGLPVVTNASGAEGLPAMDGIHAGIAEEDDALVERCVNVLQNQETQDNWRRAARALLEEYCDPKKVILTLESAYKSVGR